MPTPFPGMNPYLEQPGVWHDFHQAYITAIRNSLTPQIIPDYVARLEAHIYIHELSAEERSFLGRPDVALLHSGGSTATATIAHEIVAPAFGHIATAADVFHESFIEIRDRETSEVITIIELLSPTNKASGSDREQYIGKRKAILASNTNLVEIDLLRGSQRMPILDLPTSDYLVMVSRSIERPRVELWPFMLRDPLPVIPIPLRVDDRDATIDLGRLLQEQFDAAGYANYVYRHSPEPPLGNADADWAQELLEEARTK